jgi:hypothetical protein
MWNLLASLDRTPRSTDVAGKILSSGHEINADVIRIDEG